MKKVLRFLDEKTELYLLCFFGVLCLVAVCLQVLARIFSISLAWTEEVSRYCFIWITFIGTSFAIKNDGHICLGLIHKVLSDKASIILNIIIDIIALCIFIFVFYLSIGFIKSSVGRLAPALNISKNIVNISASVGFGLCIIRTIQTMAEEIKKLKA